MRIASIAGLPKPAFRHYLPRKAIAQNATEAEKRMWRALRENFPGAKFRRQVPTGPYFADFFSFPAKLVIEVDGRQHGEAEDYDRRRTAFLQSQGYRVIRFWNNDVLGNTEGVIEAISLSLGEREGAAKRRKDEGE